jgi:hypothetical protein
VGQVPCLVGTLHAQPHAVLINTPVNKHTAGWSQVGLQRLSQWEKGKVPTVSVSLRNHLGRPQAGRMPPYTSHTQSCDIVGTESESCCCVADA